MSDFKKIVYEELMEISKLQIEYDEAVFDKFECEWDACKCHLALVDEIGEVNHELKKLWCYWRENQSEVDRKKLLEELADCLHFAMSYYININIPYCSKLYIEIFHTDTFEEIVTKLAKHMEEVCKSKYLTVFSLQKYRDEVESIVDFKAPIDLPVGVLAVSKLCRFSFDELIEAYKEKNKINWKRLENGY
jgi:dimeric dUTPase (all-alpha-NTP-PPase superfamily)